MAQPDEISFDIGHPAPDRDRVGRLALFAGIGGGPVAWSVQIAVLASLGSLACAAGDGPAVPVLSIDWVYPAALATNIGALVVSALAFLLSFRNLSKTRHLPDQGGIIDAGEGRTRFLSIWGIFAGVLFMLAIAFSTISLLWGGLCDF